MAVAGNYQMKKDVFKSPQQHYRIAISICYVNVFAACSDYFISFRYLKTAVSLYNPAKVKQIIYFQWVFFVFYYGIVAVVLFYIVYWVGTLHFDKDAWKAYLESGGGIPK